MNTLNLNLKFNLKLKCLFCLLVFLLPALFMFAPAGGAEGAPRYVPGEALVVLKNSTGQKLSASSLSQGGTGQSRVQSVANSVQASAVQTYAALSEAADAILVHMKSGSKTTEELIADLERNPDVLSASPNYYNRLSRTPNDTRYDELWGMKKIQAENAWDTTTGSNSITIAVIDTGVDSSHPDLVQNLDMERARSFVNERIADADGHGTHVAGTVGAVGNNKTGVTGVNWEAKILPLKVFPEGEGAPASAIADALNYLTELQGKEGVRVHAVNLSLGFWASMDPAQIKGNFMYLAYKALNDTDKTVIVVAAGNAGLEVGVPAKEDVAELNVDKGDYCYPASYIDLNNMIVVGAINRDDKMAVFNSLESSNWSQKFVDIVAPGANILSTLPGGKYDSWGGTSMAAPHVAGAVGLLAAWNPTLTASELKDLLLGNANSAVNPPPTNLSVLHMSREGLLDVKAALDKVSGRTVLVESISVTPPDATLTVGEQQQFTAQVLPSTATKKNVTWSSDKSSVATVDAKTGMVRGVSAGKAVITAKAQDDSAVSGSATVTVNAARFVPVTGISVAPPSATLTIGGAQQFIAQVLPSNATNKNLTWSSSVTSVARVDAAGLAVGVGSGTAKITARAQDGSGVSGASTVVVNRIFVPVVDVSISSKTATLLLGKEKQFTATVYPPNATNRTVAWSSDDPLVAEVDEETGLVRAVGVGNTVITVATQEGNFTAEAEVSVTAPSEPPTPPRGSDTTTATGSETSSGFSIGIRPLDGESVPERVNFYIWLSLYQDGTTAQAANDIGPLTAVGVRDEDNTLRINFDPAASKTWDGKDIKVPDGKYTLRFADVATESRESRYVGEVEGPIEVKKDTGSLPKDGGGGGGCNAGWGLIVLAGVLLAALRGSRTLALRYWA
jgi:uncharacterized protein YjdB